MKTRGLVICLVVLAVCLATTAPSFAQQPSPKSYVAIDPNGAIIECFDFLNSGVTWTFLNGRKGNYESMDISGYTGTAADSMYWGQVRNIIWEGNFASRLQFTGTCEAQGGSWWGFFAADWGNASCSMTSYMRFQDFGNFNNSSSMIQLGPLAPNCDALFGRAGEASPQKGHRASK